MLPPGHVAAGFLSAQALLQTIKPGLSAAQEQNLLWWGAFWAFAPDLDIFWAFFKAKSFYYNQKDNSVHRQFLTHIPLLWLIPALLIYLFAQSQYWQMFGLVMWAGSWSHFLLDSLEYGVMWLWPVNRQVWALKNSGVKHQFSGDTFWDYWKNFLKYYCRSLTFYSEVAVLLAAAVLIQLIK